MIRRNDSPPRRCLDPITSTPQDSPIGKQSTPGILLSVPRFFFCLSLSLLMFLDFLFHLCYDSFSPSLIILIHHRSIRTLHFPFLQLPYIFNPHPQPDSHLRSYWVDLGPHQDSWPTSPPVFFECCNSPDVVTTRDAISHRLVRMLNIT